jgi:hypothetical protein
VPRSLGSGIPQDLASRLDGRHLDVRVGDTYLLATVSEDGWPHVAMLSAGEVVAHGEATLRIGLWPGTHSTANLARTGQALLVAVVPPATYYLRLRCRPLGEVPVEDRGLAAFEAEVTEALEDVVGYARVTEAIRFELNEPARILRHWAAAVAALQAASEPDTA